MQIVVKDNIKELQRELKKLSKQQMPKAINAALNKTAAKAYTTALTAVNSVTKEQKKKLKQQIKLTKSTVKKQSAIIDVRRTKPKNLIHNVNANHNNTTHFRQRKARGGYKFKGVKAKTFGKVKMHRGAFIINANTAKGKRSIVVKRVNGGNGKLEAVFGTSVHHFFWRTDTQRAIKRRIDKEINIELQRSINNIIRRSLKR